MDVRQLEAFLAVAEDSSFTRAAERLHLVQSAVSATIKSLEAELGFVLFTRGPRTVALTPEGEGFLPSARAAVAALSEAKDVAAAYRGSIRGSVSLGILATPDFDAVSNALRSFRTAYPEVAVSARTSPTGTAGLLEGIVDGSLDMSIIVLPSPLPPQVELEERMFTGDYAFAVAADHPLAGRVSEGPGILDGADFVASPRGFSNRIALDDQLSQWGVRPEIRMEVADIGTVLRCIADGFGVGLVPRHMIAHQEGVVPLELPDVTATWSIALALRRGRQRTAAMRVLIDALRAVVPDAVAHAGGRT